MKIWEKGISTDQLITDFTVGNDRELDLQLAWYDIQASEAHAGMLTKIGLLSEAELQGIKTVFGQLRKEVEEGKFEISADFEDVHSLLEFRLTQALGDTGKKIHTARSRNDQVLVALHLYAKDQLSEIGQLTSQLFEVLMAFASRYQNDLLPGYTHLQVAMPSSFGLWASAFAESLADDVYLLEAAFKCSNQNPLGSAAGYGSSFPVDRELTTELLGFETLKVNAVAAQMARGKLEKTVAFALAALAGTLSKLAYDGVVYNSQNFGFLKLPDELTTGSSIMPQKKNPDVFELIRGRCNKIQALPQEIILLTNNLTSGYHRDFQLLKESFFPAINSLKECLSILIYAFPKIEIKKVDLTDEKYRFMFAVEKVNEKVQEGIPFRDAYQQVAQTIFSGEFEPDFEVNHTHTGSIGNLRLDLIREKFEKAIAFLP